MKYYQSGEQYVLVLQKGESLTESLEAFMDAVPLSAMWVQGLGALTDVTLGFYDLEAKTYQWQDFSGTFELTGLQGNAVRQPDGTVRLHLHATLADATYRTFGGHIRQALVGGTCELLVTPVRAALVREHDAAVGLELLRASSVPPHHTV